MVEIYEYGVNLIGKSIISMAMVLFCVYLSVLAIKYALGDNLHWNYCDYLNPLENRACGIVIMVPLAVLVVGSAIAVTWPVSLPLIFIFAILHLIRMKILHKQKMRDTLKGS
jgi:hypothetical protein